MANDSFDWNRADDVIVPEQLPIRAFVNSRGNVALVQRADDPHDENQLIEIRPEYVRTVIASLTRLIESVPTEVYDG
jgi:hypothetical protein